MTEVSITIPLGQPVPMPGHFDVPVPNLKLLSWSTVNLLGYWLRFFGIINLLDLLLLSICTFIVPRFRFMTDMQTESYVEFATGKIIMKYLISQKELTRNIITTYSVFGSFIRNSKNLLDVQTPV